MGSENLFWKLGVMDLAELEALLEIADLTALKAPKRNHYPDDPDGK